MKRPEKNKAYGPDQARVYVSPTEKNKQRLVRKAQREQTVQDALNKKEQQLKEEGAIFVRGSAGILIGKIERCEITHDYRTMCYTPSKGTLRKSLSDAIAWIKKTSA